MLKSIKSRVLAVSVAALPAVSFAAPVTIETGEVVATIAAGATAISAIGVAVLSMVALVKSFKLVKAAF